MNYHYRPGNRLSQVNSETIEYDAAGNMRQWPISPRTDAPAPSSALPPASTPPTAGFIHDRRGRPMAYLRRGELIAAYRYNAQGSRSSKWLSDRVHHYRYDHHHQLVAESSSPLDEPIEGPTQPATQESAAERHQNKFNKTASLTHWVWLGRIPVAKISTRPGQARPQIIFLHSDHLNSPRLATDAQQTVVWQWRSDGFGLGQANEDPDGDGINTVINLRFPGQYYDAESGLHYNLLRYYHPRLGRYTQSDPIGLRGGSNRYAYVANNPLAWADPLGLARLQYIMVDNYGDNPTTPSKTTLKAGTNPRLQHFAFYLSDIAGAPGQSLLYDPNGTFGPLNDNGAVSWNSSTDTDQWQRFQTHYGGRSLNTGSWASVNNFDDKHAATLFSNLTGIDPLTGRPVTALCSPEEALAILPDLPPGFKHYENFAFTSYVHMLTKPTFFAGDIPPANDSRYVNNDLIPWGKLTFASEGTDIPSRDSFSRKPHWPGERSGITLGRGLDLGQYDNTNTIREALIRAGLPRADIEQLVTAVNIKGPKADTHLNANPNIKAIRISREQQYLLYLHTYQAIAKEAKRLYGDHIQDGGLPWQALHPSVQALLIDLRYRGDWHNLKESNPVPPEVIVPPKGKAPTVSLTDFSAQFQKAVNTNNRKALCEIMQHRAWTESVWSKDKPGGPSKKGDQFWGVNDDRYRKRIESLNTDGVTCKVPPI